MVPCSGTDLDVETVDEESVVSVQEHLVEQTAAVALEAKADVVAESTLGSCWSKTEHSIVGTEDVECSCCCGLFLDSSFVFCCCIVVVAVAGL